MDYVNTKIIIRTHNAGFGIRLASQLRQAGLFAVVYDGEGCNSEELNVISGYTILVSDMKLTAENENMQKIVLTSGNIHHNCINYRDDTLYVSKSIGISGICSLLTFIANKEDKERKVERAAAETIRKMGIQVNLKGYRYLITAIVITALDPEPDMMCASELYQKIADIYNVNICSVERAIRHSIETAYYRCPQALSSAFSYPVTKPNNTELICYVADTIRLWIL